MIRKFIFACLFVLSGIPAFADVDYSWMDAGSSPEVKNINSGDLACNQTEESFSSFIQKFKSDASFRKSRIRFAKDDDIAKGCFDSLDYWNDGNGFELFQTLHQENDGWATSGFWYNVTADQVCFGFTEEYVGEEEDWDGGSGFYARFQRIAGKWYITGFMCAG